MRAWNAAHSPSSSGVESGFTWKPQRASVASQSECVSATRSLAKPIA